MRRRARSGAVEAGMPGRKSWLRLNWGQLPGEGEVGRCVSVGRSEGGIAVANEAEGYVAVEGEAAGCAAAGLMSEYRRRARIWIKRKRSRNSSFFCARRPLWARHPPFLCPAPAFFVLGALFFVPGTCFLCPAPACRGLYDARSRDFVPGARLSGTLRRAEPGFCASAPGLSRDGRTNVRPVAPRRRKLRRLPCGSPPGRGGCAAPRCRRPSSCPSSPL